MKTDSRRINITGRTRSAAFNVPVKVLPVRSLVRSPLRFAWMTTAKRFRAISLS